MKNFFIDHSLTELFLCLMVSIVAIIAACQEEWATAGAISTGAFAILKGRPIQDKKGEKR